MSEITFHAAASREDAPSRWRTDSEVLLDIARRFSRVNHNGSRKSSLEARAGVERWHDEHYAYFEFTLDESAGSLDIAFHDRQVLIRVALETAEDEGDTDGEGRMVVRDEG